MINFEIHNKLTPRQREVYDLLLKGFSRQEIMETLCISEPTLKIYLHTIYTILGVSGLSEFYRFYLLYIQKKGEEMAKACTERLENFSKEDLILIIAAYRNKLTGTMQLLKDFVENDYGTNPMHKLACTYLETDIALLINNWDAAIAQGRGD